MFQPSKAAEEWADAQTEAPNETTLMRACAAGAGLPEDSDAGREWVRAYSGSIDRVAVLLAYTAGEVAWERSSARRGRA